MIIDDEVIIDESMLLLSEFVDIIKHFKSKRGKGQAALKYIYYTCDVSQQNPLVELPIEERTRDAKRRCFNSENPRHTATEKALLKAGQDCYIKYNLTRTEKFINTINLKVDQLNNLAFTTTPIIERVENASGTISQVTNVKLITGAVEGALLLTSQKEVIVEKMNGLKNKAKKRGVGEVSALNNPVFSGLSNGKYKPPTKK